MNKVQIWLAAARLRTLPLSVAGIILGNAYAYAQGKFDSLIFILALATTISFQILSNFANDYGDGVKGTDNEDRIGPARVLQQGLLSPSTLKKGIVVNVVIAAVLALTLIFRSFSPDQWVLVFVFLLLGIVAIIAAIKYTVGEHAYGYYALGDLFVFFFFGLVSVLGSYFLQTQQFAPELLLPAIAVGCLSVAVLNLNNMRDAQTDSISQKNTLAVYLGFYKAKGYHYSLLITTLSCSLIFAGIFSTGAWFFLPSLIPLFLHAKRVKHIEQAVDYDPELKVVALSTFAFAVLMGLGIILF